MTFEELMKVTEYHTKLSVADTYTGHHRKWDPEYIFEDFEEVFGDWYNRRVSYIEIRKDRWMLIELEYEGE